MRTTHLVATLAALLLLTAACDSGGDDEASPSSLETTTTAGGASTTTEGPALAEECVTEAFSVRYPEGWFANDTGEPCRWFHPEPFQLPEDTEATGIAVHVDVEPVAFDRVAPDITSGPDVAEVVSEEELDINGRAALRAEIVSSGEALLPEGTTVTTWAVKAGESTLIATTTSVADADYGESQASLDAMMRSLVIAG